MSQTPIEFAKLKLLTLSKQRLLLAQSGNWTGLNQLDAQWQDLLTQTLEKYGTDLAIIFEQISNDNNEIVELVAQAQEELNQQRKTSNKKMGQVKKYLKY